MYINKQYILYFYLIPGRKSGRILNIVEEPKVKKSVKRIKDFINPSLLSNAWKPSVKKTNGVVVKLDGSVTSYAIDKR